jgi:hypothetical protein
MSVNGPVVTLSCLRTDQDCRTVIILDRQLVTSHLALAPAGLPPFRLNVGGTLRNAACETRT